MAHGIRPARVLTGSNGEFMTRTVRTTCPYCGVGCGVLATPAGDGSVAIEGDPQHPANLGRLCSKGGALGETLDLEGRLLHPRLHGARVGWETALDHVAGEFRRVIAAHGPESVAFYVSGQILTEDYYVANKLMKGYIGAANIDTNSRLCMASSVAGHKRAFGADAVPCCYEDVELADLLVLVGSNAAWCHPVLWQRMLAARARRPGVKIVVIDPRRTATAEEADLFLPIAPGSDVALFNGLLDHLRREDRLDWSYLESHTEGYAEAFAAARETAPSIPAVAAACGLEENQVAAFYRLFSSHPRVLTLYSQGVNQASSGTDKVNGIINCHLATGRIGRPGMGPFSLTGQPNAMGGREVGGLANQLAAHMELEDPAHRALVQRYWDSPTIAGKPGLKAVEMFRALADGRIKAVWIMATNPVVSMPDADAVRAALGAAELVVVADCMGDTDTMRLAHVQLPALAWGEKDGTVTNSERRISRQRAFLPPPGEARADWWMICELARRLGHGRGFRFSSAAEIFREHARLTTLQNDGARDLDLGRLAQLDDDQYERLSPVQWPIRAAAIGMARMFEDGRFYTNSGRAWFVAVRPRAPARPTDAQYPLVLNTGRVRDHWHTMTRTAKSARLSAHQPEPRLEIHPQDARRHGLRDGMLVRVASRWGGMLVRARVSAGQRPGSVFVPMHWNDVHASLARVDAVVNPEIDPVSGQPELKHTPVRIEPCAAAWRAALMTRGEPPAAPAGTYWVKRRGRRCMHLQLSGVDEARLPLGDWKAALQGVAPGQEAIEFVDSATNRYRHAVLRAGRLESVLYVEGGDGEPPALDWIEALFEAPGELSIEDRRALLSGRPAMFARDAGPIVCACFAVGRNTILAAAAQGCRTVEAIGSSLHAGTNCGSCRSEIRELLSRAGATVALTG
jgi:assimilatory nitrate reductase catalytic subunit